MRFSIISKVWQWTTITRNVKNTHFVWCNLTWHVYPFILAIQMVYVRIEMSKSIYLIVNQIYILQEMYLYVLHRVFHIDMFDPCYMRHDIVHCNWMYRDCNTFCYCINMNVDKYTLYWKQKYALFWTSHKLVCRYYIRVIHFN